MDVLGIAAVAALAAPVVLAVLARPQHGLLVLAALVPFDGLLLILPVPAFAAGWKEALLVFTLAAAFLVPERSRTDRARPVAAWALPLVLLATLAFATSALVSPLQAAVGLKIAFFGTLTAVVVWRRPFTSRDRDHLITVLAVTGVIVALVGIGQQLVGHAWLHELGYAYDSTIRFTGGWMRSWSTFNQPFPFAFHLMLVTLVTGAVALQDPWRPRNQAILLALPLFVAGMVVAVVRASWIGLAAGIAYLAVRRYRHLLAAAPVVVATVVLGLVAGAGGFFVSRSASERLERWSVLPELVAAAPFGQGIGSAGAAAAKFASLRGTTTTFDPSAVGAGRVLFQPDNAYLKVLFELGVVGLALFTFVLLAVYATTRRGEDAGGSAGAYAAGASAVVVAAAVASVASTFFEIFPLDYLFWLVVAVVATSGLRAGPSVPPPGAPA